MRIRILKSSRFSHNEASFYDPIRRNADDIRSLGYELMWTTKLSDLRKRADILFISSRAVAHLWKQIGPPRVVSLIEGFKENCSKVFWFDLSDSSGTTQFEILPVVDKYFKMQVLKDRLLYRKQFYTGRIHGDYYKNLYNIQNEERIEYHLNKIPNDKDLNKIQSAWNYGLRWFGRRSELVLRVNNYLNKNFSLRDRWRSPSKERKQLISCRVSTSYSRSSVSLSRSMVCKMLNEYIDHHPVSYSKFIKEMEESLAVISPFGFGEVCYRDFELVRAGAVCIKQNMDHLETWPNLWQAESTYIPVKWDLSDLKPIIESLRENRGSAAEMAQNAQELYREALGNQNAKNMFLDRFQERVNS